MRITLCCASYCAFSSAASIRAFTRESVDRGTSTRHVFFDTTDKGCVRFAILRAFPPLVHSLYHLKPSTSPQRPSRPLPATSYRRCIGQCSGAAAISGAPTTLKNPASASQFCTGHTSTCPSHGPCTCRGCTCAHRHRASTSEVWRTIPEACSYYVLYFLDACFA